MDKLDLRPSLEWDAVLHGKMTYEVIEEGPESADVLVTKQRFFPAPEPGRAEAQGQVHREGWTAEGRRNRRIDS